MPTLLPRSRSWAGLILLAASVVLACSHDWDAWLPQGGTGGSSTSSSSSSSSSGSGGTGGTVVVPGVCPAPTGDEPALVKVPHPAGGAVCIEPTEVTRGDYEAWLLSGTQPSGMPAFCDFDTSHTPTADWPPGGVGLTLPVAYVSWCDALAYCLAIGRRLCGDLDGNPVAANEWSSPTGSEWFTVCTAQGTRPYPYGATYQASTCNGGDVALGQTATVTSMTGCVDATGQVHDLSGNIWEWENACSADTGTNDSCRLRGGGYTNSQNDLMCAADSTDLRGQPRITVGFRCCADILPE